MSYKLLITLWAALMSATQLRVQGLGISELIFFVYSIAVFFDSREVFLFNRRIIVLLLSLFTFLFLGWLTNVVVAKESWDNSRDAYALIYSIVGSFALISVVKFNIKYVFLGSYLAVFFLGCVLILSFYFSSINLPFDIWYGGGDEIADLSDVGRFRGWAENPNQLGLFLIAAFYYNIFYIDFNFSKKIILSIPLCIVIALVNSSAAIMGIASLIFLPKIIYLTTKKNYNYYLPVLKIALMMLAIALFLMASLVFFNKTGDFDGNGRLPLWANSVAAAMQSPLWGWGPGGHSGYISPFEGWESHNIYLDIITQVGFFGLIIFLGFIFILLRGLIEVNQFYQMSLVLSFLIYGLSHYMLRIPLFWIVLFSFYVNMNKMKNI